MVESVQHIPTNLPEEQIEILPKEQTTPVFMVSPESTANFDIDIFFSKSEQRENEEEEVSDHEEERPAPITIKS